MGVLDPVAHVGNKVAADLLEPTSLGDVLDHGDDPEGTPPFVDQPGPDGQGAPGWAVEVDLALGRSLVPHVLNQLGHCLGGRARRRDGWSSGAWPGRWMRRPCRYHDHSTTLGEGVERSPQADGVGARLSHRLGSRAGHPVRGRRAAVSMLPSSFGGSRPSRLPSTVSRWDSARWPDRRPRVRATSTGQGCD